MGDDDFKTDHGIAIDAFISAQHDSFKSTIMSAPEITETPIRDHAAPAFTPASLNGGGENGIAKGVKRLRPHSRTTVVQLVSTNATSSAFPESFGLSTSVTGRWLAAFSSSALYFLSTQHLPSYKNTSRAFRIRRKPLAVVISDAGRFAVLTTSHKVDVYHCEHGDLLKGACKKLETIHLDNEAKTLAFAWCGEIVAAGSDIGLEIKNLGPGSRETDKRYITCSAADRLMFSRDSRALLATSVVKKSRYSTFISLNESFEDAFVEELVEQQPLGKLWITQLLFPQRLQARQAALLPTSNSDLVNSEILAFDSHLDQFKIYDVTMKRFTSRELGTPEEVVWTRHHKPEEAVPAVSADASAIAVAVRSKTDKEIWVYHVPSSWWEAEPTSSPESESSEGTHNSLDATEKIKLPIVGDGAPPETITNLQWLQTQESELERLVVLVSTVNVAMPEEVVPIEAPAASGKLFLIDFADRTADGVVEQVSDIVVDLGELAATEGLMDEVLALDREVDLMRRRTQIQRNRPPVNPLPSPQRSLRRSLSSGSSGGVPTLRGLEHSNSGRSARRRRSFSSLSTNEEREEVAAVPVDEPYSQSQPRSQFSLHRAATIAANAPANRQHLRALPDRPLEYRRADGLREVPHESDADNWMPPPPVYSKEPDNVVSHPLSANPQALASYVPQPPKPPSLMQNQFSRPLSRIPPVPPLPADSNVSVQDASVMPQQQGSAPGTGTMQQLLHPRPRAARHVPNRAPTDISNALPEERREQAGVQNASSRSAAHRNADSASSTESLGSHNLTVPPTQPQRQVQPPLPPLPTPNSSMNNMASAPAMSLVTQGLPPNMTPPSPIAEFVRPLTTRRDTPSPSSPSPDQMTSLHRRSGSGESSDPRAASADLMRNLPSVPSVPPGSSPRGSAENGRPSPMRNQRPILNRLATIASVADPLHNVQQSEEDDTFTAEPIVYSASAHTPSEPQIMERRQWWRVGGARTLPRPETRPVAVSAGANVQGGRMRPKGRVVQYAPRHAATAPVGGKREKEGSKCAVM